LVKIAGGDKEHTCVLFASSGTGAMEACMSSGMPNHGITSATKKTALILSNGAYGERFASIASFLGIGSITLGVKWGEKLNPTLLDKVLNRHIGAVFMTHHETSTGILNDVKSISDVIKKRKRKIPLVVDCISSFGAIPFNIIKEGADFIIGTANKGIQGVPGISFVICKKEVMNELAWNSRSFYFNIGLEYLYQEKEEQFRFTAPTQVVYALRKALDELLKEGINNRYKRYCKNYRILVEGMHKRGFKSYLSDSIPRSKLIETFVYPENFNFNNFHNKLYKRGFTIYPGVLEKDTFRLGCTGDLYEKDMFKFLKAVDGV